MYEYVKRACDILLSSVAVLVLSPLLVPVAVILKLTGEHYIFYKQDRIGFKGKPFGLLKFATMLKDSPNLATGDITVTNDPRVLPFGHFLRKTKINELPQIINVLRGDMSIIGPRPLTRKNFDYYPAECKEVIGNMRPGLSGVGSIVFRNEETLMADSHMPCHEFYRLHIAPHKGELETWYYNNRSIWLDTMLVCFTAGVIVFPNTDLFVRLLKSLPQRPVPLMAKGDRKGGKSVVQTAVGLPRIAEIRPTARKAAKASVLGVSEK